MKKTYIILVISIMIASLFILGCNGNKEQAGEAFKKLNNKPIKIDESAIEKHLPKCKENSELYCKGNTLMKKYVKENCDSAEKEVEKCKYGCEKNKCLDKKQVNKYEKTTSIKEKTDKEECEELTRTTCYNSTYRQINTTNSDCTISTELEYCNYGCDQILKNCRRHDVAQCEEETTRACYNSTYIQINTTNINCETNSELEYCPNGCNFRTKACEEDEECEEETTRACYNSTYIQINTTNINCETNSELEYCPSGCNFRMNSCQNITDNSTTW